MSLNESTIEEAALEWFRRRQGYAGQVGEQTRCARTLTPALSHQEKKEDGEVVLVGGLREAIRRVNPAIPEEVPAVVKRYLNTRFERRQNP